MVILHHFCDFSTVEWIYHNIHSFSLLQILRFLYIQIYVKVSLLSHRLPSGGKVVNTTPVLGQTQHEETDHKTEPRSSVSDLVNSLTSEMLMVSVDSFPPILQYLLMHDLEKERTLCAFISFPPTMSTPPQMVPPN